MSDKERKRRHNAQEILDILILGAPIMAGADMEAKEKFLLENDMDLRTWQRWTKKNENARGTPEAKIDSCKSSECIMADNSMIIEEGNKKVLGFGIYVTVEVRRM